MHLRIFSTLLMHFYLKFAIIANLLVLCGLMGKCTGAGCEASNYSSLLPPGPPPPTLTTKKKGMPTHLRRVGHYIFCSISISEKLMNCCFICIGTHSHT